jgi:hypothetical protein
VEKFAEVWEQTHRGLKNEYLDINMEEQKGRRVQKSIFA